MKYIHILFILFYNIIIAQVGIGTTKPDSSAILDIYSESKGLLIPRLTEIARDSIKNPAEGLLVYQKDSISGLHCYINKNWVLLEGNKNKSLNEIITIDKIADLFNQTNSCPDINTVIVLGFHEKDDGGGGIFYFDCNKPKTSHNGGTIIAKSKNVFPSDWTTGVNGTQSAWFDEPTNGADGCWVRLKTKKRANVLWFGAKDEKNTSLGDEDDSTIPINETIKYAHITSHSVYIPSGKYIINGTIEAITNSIINKRIKITGDYMGHLPDVGTVLFRQEGGSNTSKNSPILSILTPTNSSPLLEISNLTFVGDTQNEHDGIYVETVGLNNPIFKNLHFEYIQGTPLHIKQSSTVARCEFMLIERMIVGMDWGTYDNKDINKVRPNNNNCNGIWLEGKVEYDGVKITKSQLMGSLNGTSPIILADVKGDILTIEDTQIHGSNIAIKSSIREFKISGGYIEKSTEVAIQLLNNYGSVFHGTKSFDITHTLFSQLSNIIEILDDEVDLGSSTKGYIGEFYVYSNINTNIIKNIGTSSIIEVGRYTSNLTSSSFYELSLFDSLISSIKRKNITGYSSHLYNSKNERLNRIIFTPASDNIGHYEIKINSTESNDWGLIVERKLTNGAIYNPIQLGNAGGFKLKTSNSTGSKIKTAIYSDWSGNVGIGMDSSASEQLEVMGNVKAHSFISNSTIYPDYVFEKYYNFESKLNPNYRFKPLNEVEKYLKKNFHLEAYKGVEDVKKDKKGNYIIDLGEQSTINKEKIEELFIYIIEQNKEMIILKKQIQKMKTKLLSIKKNSH
jgi:hypothetical protein